MLAAAAWPNLAGTRAHVKHARTRAFADLANWRPRFVLETPRLLKDCAEAFLRTVSTLSTGLSTGLRVLYKGFRRGADTLGISNSQR